MTASQLPVAMRLISVLRRCLSKSSRVATRILAPDRGRGLGGELTEHVVGDHDQGFAARPSRRSSIAAAAHANVFPDPTTWASRQLASGESATHWPSGGAEDDGGIGAGEGEVLAVEGPQRV